MTASRLHNAIDQHGLHVPPSGRYLVLRADPGCDYSDLQSTELYLQNSFRPHFDRLAAIGNVHSEFPQGPFVFTLVQITRSKAETLGLIGTALSATSPGCQIAVDGSKTDGIESVLKQCKKHLQVDLVVSKSHGKLFTVTTPTEPPSEIVNWINQCAPVKKKAGFYTAPGMFSPDKIDTGSELLAKHFRKSLSGYVADFGAGWGWLASQALSAGKIRQLDLYEAEKTALDVAKLNITDTRVRFFWEDVTKIKAGPRYDAIICNPPFHQSRKAEPGLGLTFIQSAAGCLEPNGVLWMVANRQLPYEVGLGQYFGKWTVLEETHHFKAIMATKPLAAKTRNRFEKPVSSR